jgi:glucokinase
MDDTKNATGPQAQKSEPNTEGRRLLQGPEVTRKATYSFVPRLGVCWRLMPEPLVVGLDLSGTRVSAAVVDPAGTILHRIKQPVRKSSFQDSVAQIVGVFEDVIAEGAVSRDDIGGVGISVPGIYFSTTGKAWSPGLWGWDQVPLWQTIEKSLPSPVVIDSDRAAGVLGEQWLGVARGLSDVVFLSLGESIGAGIVSGGRLCRGAGDLAGTIGWMAVDPRRKENYKRVGCLDAEAAGPAIGQRAAAHISQGERTLIGGLAGSNTITAEVVLEAARRGDTVATRVFEETAAYLAMAVANLISLLNPEVVVLGGTLIEAGELLLNSIRRQVLEWTQPLAASQVRIEMSQLGEDASLFGAARLPLLFRSSG